MLTLDHEIGHAQEDLLLQLRLGGCRSVGCRARAEHDLQNLHDIVRMEEVQWARYGHVLGMLCAWFGLKAPSLILWHFCNVHTPLPQHAPGVDIVHFPRAIHESK